MLGWILIAIGAHLVVLGGFFWAMDTREAFRELSVYWANLKAAKRD